MARPGKQGMEYFPLDVDQDQDDKLGMIIGEFQAKGELFWIKLLAFIYKNHGYYTEWGEDAQLRFLRRYNYCGFSVSFINEVVPRLIKWGLLDQSVFNSFHILTSVRIQSTWLDATRKRKGRKYVAKIWLLRVNDGMEAEETELMAEETIQSKVKEIKEEEKKENSAPETFKNSAFQKGNPPPLVAPPSSSGPPVDDVIRWFRGAGGTEEMARKFWNKWDASDWMDGHRKIVRWASLAGNFITTYQENERKNGPLRKQTVGESVTAVNAAFANLKRDMDATERQWGEAEADEGQ